MEIHHWTVAVLLCLLSFAALPIVSADDYDGDGGDCEFRCPSQPAMCILQDWVCDGDADCKDGEDEFNCIYSCDEDEFKCSDHECLDLEMRCDGEADCNDGSDEMDCENNVPLVCGDSEMKCATGVQCVSTYVVCDGEENCLDGSDEEDCPSFTCDADEYQCENTTYCIPKDWICDGAGDCPGESDENCSDEVRNCSQFLCEDKSKCLPLSDVCDSNFDCNDGSDEFNDCHRKCQQLGCSSGCIPSGDEYPVCACEMGYVLQEPRNKTCIDIDECTISRDDDHPQCSHQCINTPGSFTCQCLPLYALEPDQRTCRVKRHSPLLLFSTKNQIRRYSLRRNSHEIIVDNLASQSVQDMDMDARIRSRKVFWIDSFQRKVLTVSTRSGYKNYTEVATGLVLPTAVSYNWHADLLYVVDQHPGVIKVCDLQAEDKLCSSMVTGLAERKPEDIIVDPLSRHMYWTEIAFPARIVRRDLYRGSQEVFLQSLVMSHPDHLTIDYPRQNLYWVDKKTGVIYIVPINTDLAGREYQAVVSYDVNHPSAIAVIEDKIIWSEKQSGNVMVANKFTGRDRHRIFQHSSGIGGILVMHAALQPSARGADICESNEVFCRSQGICITKEDLCRNRVVCRMSESLDCTSVRGEAVDVECPDESYCEHLCTWTSTGPVCSCDHGMVVSANKHNCTDIDECLISNGECSQLCRNTVGSHRCSCVEGYTLVGKTTCRSKDRHLAHIMVSTTEGIFKVPMDGENEEQVVYLQYPLRTFDVFPVQSASTANLDSESRQETGHLIWAEQLDPDTSVIVKESQEQKSVGYEITIIRVDAVTANIYYIARAGAAMFHLIACDKDVSNCVMLISGDEWEPQGLVFRQATRMMYWLDLKKHTIDGSNMDGQNRRQVVDKVISRDHLLTLDSVRERFFWVYQEATIQTCKLDGSDMKDLASRPMNLIQSLDIFDGYLYVTEANSNSVQTVASFSSRPIFAEVCKMQSATGLRVMHTAPRINNPCSAHQCTHLCVLSRMGARCLCQGNATEICDGNVPDIFTPLKSAVAQNPIPQTSTTTRYPATPGPQPAEGAGGGKRGDEPCQIFCLNAGSCVTVAGSPICRCTEGYRGERCEYVRYTPAPIPPTTTTSTASTPTTSPTLEAETPPPDSDASAVPSTEPGPCQSYCLGAGTCIIVNGAPTCLCVQGLSGERCNIVSLNSDSQDNTSQPVPQATVAPPGEQPQSLSDWTVVGIVIGVITLTALLVVIAMVWKRSRLVPRLRVRYEKKDDEAALVSASATSKDACYCKWDLDGTLLNSSSSSSGSAVDGNLYGPERTIFQPPYHVKG